MMKRKMMVPVVALLLCVAMVSVGFAAWVITTTTTDTASSNFKAHEVTDNRWFFKASVSGGDVIFGAPATMDTTGAWLTATNVDTENLTVTINLTPKADASGSALTWSATKYAGKTVTYNVKEITVPSEFNTAEDNGYVAAAPDIDGVYTVAYSANGVATIKKDGVEVTASADDTDGVSYNADTGVLSIQVEFDWGSVTNGNNPFEFFKGKDANATVGNGTYADQALAMLQGIYALNGKGYSVTVEGSLS
ncbi:MAG: hypothetical protein IJX13_02680 [Clostridia bacterium]|nr:hypothetical protein [Clostridia bacterium]